MTTVLSSFYEMFHYSGRELAKILSSKPKCPIGNVSTEKIIERFSYNLEKQFS